MNYEYQYYKIIDYRKNNPLPDDAYGENHHIKPKSEGGTNDKDNLVRLTAREHYICHLLLAKIYDDYKMYAAVIYMQSAKERWKSRVFKFNSRLYDIFRKEYSEKCKGRKMSDVTKQKLSKNNGSHRQEVRDKISKSNKGKHFGKKSERTKMLMSKNNCMRRKDIAEKVRQKLIGKHHTEETKQYLKIKMKEICNTPEAKQKFSAWQKGKPKPSKWRKVSCYDTSFNLVKIYESLKSAALDGYNRHSILNAYRKNILYNNYYWRYEENKNPEK